MRITLLEKGDVERAVKVLSVAMLDNPLHLAVFGGQGEAERQINENRFLGLFRGNPGVVFVAFLDDEIAGVMRMNSCHGRQVSDEGSGNGDINSLKWRQSVWQNEWARHDPGEQHWHLGPIGVLPAHQGKGVGGKLMERFCAEVDACSSPAYLETDTDNNVKFYQKFGFKVVGESDILGVNSRYMLRDPAQ